MREKHDTLATDQRLERIAGMAGGVWEFEVELRALAAEFRSLLDKCARQEAALRAARGAMNSFFPGRTVYMGDRCVKYECTWSDTGKDPLKTALALIDAALNDGSNKTGERA